MSLELRAGPTARERLAGAIARLRQKHGFCTVDRETPEFPAGLAVLLLTEDPQRNPEVLDACVILPEALKAFGGNIACYVAEPEVSPALLARYGAARAPAAIFLRDGVALGCLPGIRDWSEYCAEVERLAQAPSGGPLRKAVAIPVRVEHPGGHCA